MSFRHKALAATMFASLAALSMVDTAQASALHVVQGSYVGDGQSLRFIACPGVDPEVVLLQGEDGSGALLKTATMPDPFSKSLVVDVGRVSDGIAGLKEQGFYVSGVGRRANVAGVTYHYLVFEGGDGEMAYGTYVGDEVDDRAILGLGFPPCYVLVAASDAQEVQHRFEFEAVNQSQLFGASGPKADRIQDFLPNGFEVGKHKTVNGKDLDFDWVAWSRSSPLVADITYGGDGTSPRPIKGLGLSPDLVLIKSEDASGPATLRFRSMKIPQSLIPVGSTPVPEGILQLDEDGFSLGGANAVNRDAKVYYGVTFQSSDRLDLSLTKSVNDSTPLPGQTVQFTVKVINPGPLAATGVAVRDSLPSGFSYQGHQASAGIYDAGSGVWSLPTLSGPGEATLRIDASVGLADLGRVLVNRASILSADQVDTVGSNDSAQAAVGVGVITLTVDVGVGLAMDQTTPAVGDTVLVKVAATNASAETATGTEVQVNVPADFEMLDAAASQGSYVDGVWSVGDLAGATSASLDLRVVVADGTAGNRGSVRADLTHVDQIDATLGNNSDSVDYEVSWVDLEVSASADAARPLEGQAVRLVTYVRNLAPFEALGVAIRDSLPPELVFESSQASAGSYDSLAGRWDVGSVAAGGVDSLVIHARVNSGGNLSPFGMVAELLDSTPSDVNASNDATTAILQMAQVDLVVAKHADRNQSLELEVVNYTVTVTNDGPDVATGVVLEDTLATWLEYAASSVSRGSYDPGTGIWDGFDLALGETATLSLSARVASGTTGALVTNTASVVGRDQLERNPVDDTGSASVQIVSGANASIRVSASDQSGGILRPGDAPGVVLELEFHNEGPVAATLNGVSFTNLTTGVGEQVDLDADWAGLRLTSGSDATLRPLDTLEFVDGRLDIDGLGLRLPVGQSVGVRLWGGASLTARDGDVLDVAVPSSEDLRFAETPVLSGSFPLSPFAAWSVDGMSAAQIGVLDFVATSFRSNSVDNLALGVVVPPDGYVTDTLTKINVTNRGSAEPGVDIEAIRAWEDDGDRKFDAAADRPLGTLVFTGSRWELTHLSVPVPLEGRAIFVTVDVAEAARKGRTIRLALPPGQDAALGMVSTNDGPVDREVLSPAVNAITTADNVALAAVPLSPGTAEPGADDALVLQLSVSNSYTVDRTLRSLRVSNATAGPGSKSELDREVAAVVLRADGNADGVLDSTDVDPELGRSFFQDGVADFSGLDWTLAPEESRQLFVTFEVDAHSAADGDALAAAILDPADVQFEGDTALAASWPLDSEASCVVDGMLASQISHREVPAVALGPGEGPALALDVVLPANGYQDDVLNGITVTNTGSAVASDLGEMRLWRDGGDGSFDGGSGDDVDLGAMVALAEGWQSVLLSEPIVKPGARFFVGVSTSSTPTDSATVSLQIPPGGVTMSSGNDGPHREPVVNSSAVLLSQAPLLAQLEIEPGATTVGSPVTVRMIVRNVSGETVTGVTPSALDVVGDSSLSLSGGPSPGNFDLAAAARDTFEWTFDATAAGPTQLQGNASGTGSPSSIVRVALPALSNVTQVFTQADSLGLTPVVTSPFSVNRGQTNVVPMSLTFDNPAGAGGSDILLTALRVRLENNQGAGIVPSSLLSRVVVNEGPQVYLEKTALESSGSEMGLTLASAARVIPEEPATLNLQFDLLSSTVVPDFRVVVTQSTWVSAEDANSGAPIVSYLQQGSFPVVSGLATVLAEAESLSVAPVAMAGHNSGAGQTGLLAGAVELTNVGVDGLTSDIRVSRMRLALVDESGSRVADPGAVISRLEVGSAVQSYASLPLNAGQDSVIVVDLSPQISAPVNAPLPVQLKVDTRGSAPLGRYRLRWEDASTFDAADAITRTPVAVTYTESPLQGTEWNLQAPASELRLSGSGGLPASASAGEVDLQALDLRLRHPGSGQTAAIAADTLRVRVLDEHRQPVPLGGLVSAMRVRWEDAEVANLAIPGGASSTFEIPLGGQLLAAGDTAAVQLRLDLAATAPPGSYEVVFEETDLRAHDANTAAAVDVRADGATSLPISSGLMRLVPPSTQLRVDLSGSAPATLVQGQTDVGLAALRLQNPAATGSSDLRVRRLTLRATDRDRRSLALGEVLSGLRLYDATTEIAATASLTADSTTATLQFAEIGIAAAASRVLELRGDLQATLPANGVRFEVDGSDVGVASTGVVVIPVEGRSFPLFTKASSLGAAEFAASYANFPNPFHAGKESTAFAYFLEGPASVTLRVYTLTGETVITLLDREAKAAGMHQEDSWNGRNGQGEVLRNGVYLARILVEYDDGRRAEELRKVAVVR